MCDGHCGPTSLVLPINCTPVAGWNHEATHTATRIHRTDAHVRKPGPKLRRSDEIITELGSAPPAAPGSLSPENHPLLHSRRHGRLKRVSLGECGCCLLQERRQRWRPGRRRRRWSKRQVSAILEVVRCRVEAKVIVARVPTGRYYTSGHRAILGRDVVLLAVGPVLRRGNTHQSAFTEWYGLLFLPYFGAGEGRRRRRRRSRRRRRRRSRRRRIGLDFARTYAFLVRV